MNALEKCSICGSIATAVCAECKAEGKTTYICDPICMGAEVQDHRARTNPPAKTGYKAFVNYRYAGESVGDRMGLSS